MPGPAARALKDKTDRRLVLFELLLVGLGAGIGEPYLPLPPVGERERRAGEKNLGTFCRRRGSESPVDEARAEEVKDAELADAEFELKIFS